MPDRQLETTEEAVEHGLVDHLRAAIRQNVARRPDYQRRGGWRAWMLSVVLVAHERALLPFAVRLDRQARPFQREGIPILSADLQPMSLSPPPGRQLEGVGAWPKDWHQPLFDTVLDSVRTVRSLMRTSTLDTTQFRAVAHEVAKGLDALEVVERATRARLALTAHVAESIGVTAVNAVRYAEASQRRTLRLSRRFVLGQLLLLPGAVRLDLMAGIVHARGVPIFIDDVPSVPFHEALAALEARQLERLPDVRFRGTDP